MKTPSLQFAPRAPNPGMLRALGFALLIVGFAQAQTALFLPYFLEGGSSEFIGTYLFMLVFLSIHINLASVALEVIAIWNMLRRTSDSSAYGKQRSDKQIRFIHFAVAAYAAMALPTVLPAVEDRWVSPEILSNLIWLNIAGAGAVLTVLNGARWNLRLALIGAAVSVAAFGCAVFYVPKIYGWDLRPLGWSMILASSVPALMFLVAFLRRAFAFYGSVWIWRGAAVALFAALCWAVWQQMMTNPADKFGGSLRAAFEARSTEIRFSDLTDFKWDTVEIYGPYTFDEDLSPTALEKTDIIARSYLGYNETADLLLFLNGERVAHYEVVHGQHIDYQSTINVMVLERENAVFSAEYAPGGFARLALQEPAAPPP